MNINERGSNDSVKLICQQRLTLFKYSDHLFNTTARQGGFTY